MKKSSVGGSDSEGRDLGGNQLILILLLLIIILVIVTIGWPLIVVLLALM